MFEDIIIQCIIIKMKASYFNSLEVLTGAATIAAHANAASDYFRQKNVRFLIELFFNWTEEGIVQINNTQVLRHLQNLVDDGLAKKSIKAKHPRYRLTRPGLLEIVRRLTDNPAVESPAQFLFLYYFIRSYGPRITELVENEGSDFPTAIKLEIASLLDSAKLLNTEIESVKLKIRKLTERIKEVEKAHYLTKSLLKKGKSVPEVVRQINSNFPYSLNSQKPLTELFSELPVDGGRWELEQGNIQRVNVLWKNSKTMKENYLQLLERLIS